MERLHRNELFGKLDFNNGIYSLEEDACVKRHLFKCAYFPLVSTTLFFSSVLVIIPIYSAIVWKLSSYQNLFASFSLPFRLSSMRHKGKRKGIKMSVAILYGIFAYFSTLFGTVLYSIYWNSSQSDGAVSAIPCAGLGEASPSRKVTFCFPIKR